MNHQKSDKLFKLFLAFAAMYFFGHMIYAIFAPI